ncbi:MAG: hypothetical protein HYX99_02110 [Chloroflexi bacterium]|nr:hypothetical protein [Chloroflexota bacterium]
MAKEPFSMHSGLRPRPETPVYGEVPERIRTAFIYLLRDFVKYASIYTPFGQRLGKLVPLPGSILGAIQLKIVDLEVEKMVTGCAWYEFYDLCEEAYKHIHDTSKWDAEEFTKNLNKIFTEESIGYKLVRGPSSG